MESWETTNGHFTIRATAIKEELSLPGLPGTFYTFASFSAKENSWKEIFVLRHDDRPPIPKSNIRFIDNLTGLVFMESIYAVTTDAGATWSIWDATKSIPNWNWYEYGAIKDVQLFPDGKGLMVMKPQDDSSRNDVVDIQFRTVDYGCHWNREN